MRGLPTSEELRELRARQRPEAAFAGATRLIGSARIDVFSQLDHAARYVNAARIETEVLQEPRGATDTAAEIESLAAGDVLGDDRGQIAVCERRFQRSAPRGITVTPCYRVTDTVPPSVSPMALPGPGFVA
jgi:hypothetical protein